MFLEIGLKWFFIRNNIDTLVQTIIDTTTIENYKVFTISLNKNVNYVFISKDSIILFLNKSKTYIFRSDKNYWEDTIGSEIYKYKKYFSSDTIIVEQKIFERNKLNRL